MLKISLRLLFLLVALAGCKTTPAPTNEADPGAPVVWGEPLDPPPLTVVTAPANGDAPELDIIGAELDRAMAELADEPNPPYYLSYQLTDTSGLAMSGSNGALDGATVDRGRIVDIDVRVGSPTLDNTRELRGQWSGDHFDWHYTLAPWELDPAVKRSLWRMTEDRYRAAVERYLEVVANHEVRAADTVAKADFSSAPALQHVEPVPAALTEPSDDLKEMLRRLSKIPAGADTIETVNVSYDEKILVRRQVSSEGARVRKARRVARISWYASASAEDGMTVWLYDSIDSYDPATLWTDEAALRSRIEQLVQKVAALRDAPLAEPYVGPAILDPEPAGVLFHEALGHRVEGHRQSDVDEGQTFAKKIGEPVMPAFMSVFDDPRAASVGETDLMGHYRVDDEAVGAAHAEIVKHGVLTGFLMSRKPAPGFDSSNGHGRRQAGKHVVARQGNLVAVPSHALDTDSLKALLLEEVARQKLPHGLRISMVRGGYTFTGRAMPQSFRLLPLEVYRVYPDGREELVRGANMDGTPLTVLSEIMAAGNDWGVFNGHCGAESGQVPVSSVSPSLLLRRLETSRGRGGADRPPVLAPPSGEPK